MIRSPGGAVEGGYRERDVSKAEQVRQEMARPRIQGEM